MFRPRDWRWGKVPDAWLHGYLGENPPNASHATNWALCSGPCHQPQSRKPVGTRLSSQSIHPSVDGGA